LPGYLLGTIPGNGDAGVCWNLKLKLEHPSEMCQLILKHLANSLNIIRGRMLKEVHLPTEKSNARIASTLLLSFYYSSALLLFSCL